jgi:hypothetical protein
MTDKPKKLSDTARAVLTLAAARDDHLIRPPRLPFAAAQQVARSLFNRTTARVTATTRMDMRQKRKALALSVLRKVETRAGVARAVGLSPSRITAMFKGQKFPTKPTKRTVKISAR